MRAPLSAKRIVTADELEGAHRQRLLTAARVPGTNILLDRSLRLQPGVNPASQRLTQQSRLVPDAATAKPTSRTTKRMCCRRHTSPSCRPASARCCRRRKGAALLYAEIPDASTIRPALRRTNRPRFRVVDWTREPAPASQHDARKRIYVATPKLFGTKAIKGEMIIYPPGTRASNHHHEGAEHLHVHPAAAAARSM